MFVDQNLQEHLESSSVIRSNSAIIAEWNMNSSDNILRVGNYRYRPLEPQSKYRTLINVFSEYDDGYFYTSATDADITVDGGVKDDGTPQTFLSKKQKEAMLYSLEDCFYRFRPRSGINKLRYFESKFTHFVNENMALRPRYYVADKDDKFKYWTSYRTETLYKYDYPTYTSYGAEPTFSYTDSNDQIVTKSGDPVANTERGISKRVGENPSYYIDDTVPFVVYKKSVPANRIIIKMQTGVGSVNLGPFSNSAILIDDPFYGYSNQQTPVKWKVQYLDNNNWVDAVSFDKNSTRRDGSTVVGTDGYVELGYGLIVPDQYLDIFKKSGELYSSTLLPAEPLIGAAYLVKSTESELGTYHIYTKSGYQTFTPSYGWYLVDDTQNDISNHVVDLTSPIKYQSGLDGKLYYREFSYLSGLRIIVESMNTDDSPFDLIELSPRLSVDLSEKTSSFSITKIASDLGASGLPVSQLLASTGSLDLFDYDEAFNENNSESIISGFLTKNMQLKFYEIIQDVDDPNNDGVKLNYHIPIKTMYAEGFPSVSSKTRQVRIQLRDLYFYFESMTAPQLLMQNVSVSSAISTLLDSIGFSNYSFKRVSDKEEIIPYFYIAPDKTVAQVLNDIAISVQAAMFFDEYNNLVIMSREYMMPSLDDRPVDIILYGSDDSIDDGILENKTTRTKLANISDIASQENKVYNDGQISYTLRSIEKSYGSIKQASLVDVDKTWIYKPALLWEVSGTDLLKSTSGKVEQQSDYVLGAIPLNSDLTDLVPEVSNFRVVNNTIDLGEGIYWMTRYNGYLYANGEIIKFDAIQFSIPGISVIDPNNPNIDGNNVWITSVQEYQNYFSKLPFNGKIYPTGLVRIFTEPQYEIDQSTQLARLKNGKVSRHGRGQFGTPVVAHTAGLSSTWTSDDYMRGIQMKSKYLFNDLSNTTEIDGATSSGTTVSVDDISLVKKGQIVSVYDSTLEDFVSLVADEKITVASVSTVKTGGKYTFTLSKAPTTAISDKTIRLVDDPIVIAGLPAGATAASKQLAQKTTRNGIIRNFLSSSYISETDLGKKTKASTETGTIQSSAFIMSGPALSNSYKPIDFVSYAYKPLDDRYRHFGTRMRVIGQIEDSKTKAQTPFGSTEYFSLTGGSDSSTLATSTPDQSVTIAGSSGGIGIMVNPETNSGYFFEIVALSEANVEAYASETDIHNVVFYKVMQDVDSKEAIPIKLWGGLSQILVDDGKFTGQYRMTGEENPTVYDLSVEYKDIGRTRRFYLYLNDRLVATVDDPDPLYIYNNVALFIRGASRCMFENIYAITENYSQNTSFTLETPIADVFEDKSNGYTESFRKYAMSGVVKSAYLSGISISQPPQYNMYFEEFGTIMREASYFNVRYDKAYPALHAKLSPTFNKVQGYTVSGFMAGSYGAEFLVFNSTDTAISLDAASGNYLRIQGVTFTQESDSQLTVDDYFSKKSNFSNPTFTDSVEYESDISYNLSNVLTADTDYKAVKSSRITHGRNEFSITAPYIQSHDDANTLMGWITSKIMKPRKSIGLNIFAMPTLQLGDIVKLDIADSTNVGISSADSRFVVYNIDYSKSGKGPEMTVYLSEVV